jgi:hypothetical protein
VDPTDVIVIEIAYDRRRLELAMKAVVGAQELCALSKVTVQESKELLRQLDDTHAGSARVCAADCFTSSRSLARSPRSKSQPLQPSVAPTVRLKVRPNHRFDVKRCGTGSE